MAGKTRWQPTAAPRRRWASAVRFRGFMMALLGLALVSSMTMPLTAQAVPNADVIVKNVTLTTTDGGQATVGDILTVAGSWDATEANPAPGDTFTIGLPVELRFQQAVPFNLNGPDPEGNTVTWASCLTDPATGIATCTFEDPVATYPESVLGSFEFDVEAVLETVEKDVAFSLNGTVVRVDLPGTGGIDSGIVLPTDWQKTGTLNSNKWSVRWVIELPGSRMAGKDAINISERLSANHQLCSPAGLKVETVRGSTVADVTSIAGISEADDPYDFTISLEAPGSGFDKNVTYRVTYNTCTPNGEIDPQGTRYENEATIDVWGESSGVIGVEQDWSVTGLVSKQGSVLGNAERNGRIRWNVTVAGAHLVGKDAFSLTETLSGDHRVCDDTVSGMRVFEKYGPSTDRRTEVTDKLDISAGASSAQAFEARLSIDDPSFAFKPSNHLYVIQYVTCATTDGLPTAGTKFGNSANVDGVVASGSATVPGRTDQKSGQINTSSVTLDGVEHLPQTTLGWSITVPGENLADIDTPLTLTDTLTNSHQVCEGPGTLASRLGLRVEARDQISGGGLGTVDLTSSVTATLDGGVLTLVVAPPTLPQPGGGTEEGFSREYQFVFSYTTCTTSGGMDAPGTTYGNQASVAGKTYEHSFRQTNGGSGTGQGMTRGTVAVTKLLADTPGAALVPAETTFTVHVKEIDPTGTTQVSYDLAVAADGTPVRGLNARGRGWTIELSEPRFPNVTGITFGSPTFKEGPGITLNDDHTVATAALTPSTNVAVSLTNTAKLGSVSVVKQVEGEAASQVDPDKTFPVTARIDTSELGDDFPAQPDRTINVSAKEPTVLEDLPIGARVSFSEQVPADDDTLTWGEARITPQTLTVEAEQAVTPAEVIVTNQVERSVGTFSVAKTVTGEQRQNPAVPDTVEVTATWDEEGKPGSLDLTLPTDGTPVALGRDLLIGTKVTLTEKSLPNHSSIAWGAPVWSGEGVTVDGASAVVTVTRDAQALVSLDNHAATSTAGINLIKAIAGEATGEVPAEAQFPITASWTDSEGNAQSKELLINASAPTPLGVDLPAGTVVTIKEGDRPTIDTVVWRTITISGPGVTDAGDGSATIVVSDLHQDTSLVSVVNEATWAPGTLSLAKQVEGVLLDNPDVAPSVAVTATWATAEGGTESTEVSVPTDGTVVPLGVLLPHGTEVTLKEAEQAPGTAFTWAAPTWSGATPQPEGSAVVTIGAANVAEVVLTNTADPLLGSLTLAKGVAGDGVTLVPGATQYPFTATWTDLLGQEQSVDIVVQAGKDSTLEGIPLGTPVTITESETDLPDSVRWASVDWQGGENVTLSEDGRSATIVVTGGAGTQAAISAENSIVVAPSLPLAGTSATNLALGLAALGGVAALIALGRRRLRRAS